MRICLICPKRDSSQRIPHTTRTLLPSLQPPLPPQLGPLPIDIAKVPRGRGGARALCRHNSNSMRLFCLHTRLTLARLALPSPSPFLRPTGAPPARLPVLSPTRQRFIVPGRAAGQTRCPDGARPKSCEDEV